MSRTERLLAAHGSTHSGGVRLRPVVLGATPDTGADPVAPSATVVPPLPRPPAPVPEASPPRCAGPLVGSHYFPPAVPRPASPPVAPAPEGLLARLRAIRNPACPICGSSHLEQTTDPARLAVALVLVVLLLLLAARVGLLTLLAGAVALGLIAAGLGIGLVLLLLLGFFLAWLFDSPARRCLACGYRFRV